MPIKYGYKPDKITKLAVPTETVKIIGNKCFLSLFCEAISTPPVLTFRNYFDFLYSPKNIASFMASGSSNPSRKR